MSLDSSPVTATDHDDFEAEVSAITSAVEQLEQGRLSLQASVELYRLASLRLSRARSLLDAAEQTLIDLSSAGEEDR